MKCMLYSTTCLKYCFILFSCAVAFSVMCPDVIQVCNYVTDNTTIIENRKTSDKLQALFIALYRCKHCKIPSRFKLSKYFSHLHHLSFKRTKINKIYYSCVFFVYLPKFTNFILRKWTLGMIK